MSSLRRKSYDRLRLAVQDRDTLLPCGACKANGMIMREEDDGSYMAKRCRWCDGSGGVTRETAAAHARWLRILAHNQKAGACKAK